MKGRTVKIVPQTPEDPHSDLEECLAALQKLGPTEFDPGEREAIGEALKEMDRFSRDSTFS